MEPGPDSAIRLNHQVKVSLQGDREREPPAKLRTGQAQQRTHMPSEALGGGTLQSVRHVRDGKSAVLEILGGVEEPDRGQVTFDGR
jgi:hypothetical protein